MKLRVAPCFAALLVSVLLNLVPSRADGQTDLGLARGDRVRVSHADRCCGSPQVGTLVSITADSVVLRTEGKDGGRLIALPRGSVRRLELGRDVGNYAWRGATLGAAIGAAAATTIVLTQDCKNDEICSSFRPLHAVLAAGVGAAGGLLVGGLIGGALRRVEWVPTTLPAQVGLAPGRAWGFAIRLTVGR